MSSKTVSTEAASARRILVVEDERVVRIQLAAQLARLGYQVAGQACSGAEAVQMAGDLLPDLALMDVVLDGAPGVSSGNGREEFDGIEAAARIGRAFDIPVIFLTAHADEETLARAKLAGPFGYLVKPPSDVDLRTAVELALYKHGVEAELRLARDEAREADSMKASFLATMSHELRTPMNGILGMVELLLQADMDSEHKEDVLLLKDSAKQLMGVLNHILEYSKLEAQHFDLNQGDFRLRDLLDGVAERYGIEAREAGCGLETEVDPALGSVFYGDARALGRVLDQLVDNAIRHGGPGCIRVRATVGAGPAPATPKDDAFRMPVLFQVLDQGAGIPTDKLERIFDSFIQVESYLTRTHGGLGLGLAMCRKLVRAMGGRIWAEPGPEGGSNFSLLVPLIPRGDRMAAAADRPDMAGTRVLVADDDMVSRLFVLRSLEKNGVTALGAEDGGQALDILGRMDVDAVLMDVEMPGYDGIQVTRRVRAGEAGCPSDLPIIALTAHALWGDEKRCREVGMNDYLAKPVDTGTMLATLGRHVRSRSGDQM